MRKPASFVAVQIIARCLAAAGFIFGLFGVALAVLTLSQLLAVYSIAAICLGLIAAFVDVAIEYLAVIAANTASTAEALARIVESQSRKKAS